MGIGIDATGIMMERKERGKRTRRVDRGGGSKRSLFPRTKIVQTGGRGSGAADRFITNYNTQNESVGLDGIN